MIQSTSLNLFKAIISVFSNYLAFHEFLNENVLARPIDSVS